MNKLPHATRDLKTLALYAVLGVLQCSPLLSVALPSPRRKVSCSQGLQVTRKGLLTGRCSEGGGTDRHWES